MEQFFEGIGSARQKSNYISNSYMRTIISISVFSFFCKNVNAQSLSPERYRKHLDSDTVQQVDLKAKSRNDFSVASIQGSQPILLTNSLRGGSEKCRVGKRSNSRQNKIRNDQFLIEMNRKLDSAWRKFDQGCRARDNLSN